MSNLTLMGVGSSGAVTSGPITLDTTGHANAKQTANFNYSITIGSGVQQMLAVAVVGLGSTSGPGLTVKDGTTAMNLAVAGLDSTFGSFCNIYYLAGLSSGAHTINVTIGTATYCYSAAVSLFGVKQASPVDTSNSAFLNNGPSATVSLNTASNGTWIVSGFVDINGNWQSPASTNQTVFYSSDNNFLDGGMFGYMGPNTPAGNYSPEFHTVGGGSTFGEMAAAAFIP